jgi:hypothetical protein
MFICLFLNPQSYYLKLSALSFVLPQLPLHPIKLKIKLGKASTYVYMFVLITLKLNILSECGNNFASAAALTFAFFQVRA